MPLPRFQKSQQAGAVHCCSVEHKLKFGHLKDKIKDTPKTPVELVLHQKAESMEESNKIK